MTASKANFNIVVLWEHEIRLAVKALDKIKKKNATPEDISNALKACFTAIYHPEILKNQPLTIMSANNPMHRK